jgi:hypothetical protein
LIDEVGNITGDFFAPRQVRGWTVKFRVLQLWWMHHGVLIRSAAKGIVSYRERTDIIARGLAGQGRPRQDAVLPDPLVTGSVLEV